MFTINDDLSIYVTRGDILFFKVSADDNGEAHKFQPGDVVRMTVFEKKACNCVVLQKDFPVMEETEFVDIFLTEEETRFCDLISKPVVYWYEIELNPLTNPQTIVGYDDDGAKVFKVFPEGKQLEEPAPDIEPEEIPIIDRELDLLSPRPVENRVVSAAIIRIEERSKATDLFARETAEETRAEVAAHTQDKANPHSVTKEQVGLGNVPNVGTNDQTPTYDQAEMISELTSGEKLSAALGKLKKAVSDLISHLGNKNNPHSVTAAQAGARPDTWLPDASEVGAAPVSHVGDTNNPHCVTAEQVGARPDTWIPTPEEVGAAEAGAVQEHLNNTSNPHAVTAEQVGARPDTWTPTAVEVGARPDNWMPTVEEVGAVPSTRTVNGKELSSDITITHVDVGACAITKLWLNDNSQEAFEAQTIQIEGLSEYTHIGVVTDWNSKASWRQLSGMQIFELSAMTGDSFAVLNMVLVGTEVESGSRKMSYDGTTGIIFQAGKLTNKENNTAIVPYAIYGIKGVLA